MTALRTKHDIARPARALRQLVRCQNGAAAAEMALLVSIMTVPFANVVDLAIYSFRKVQVELAAEAGVQAIRGMCEPSQVPITEHCTTGLVDQIVTAIQSTTLGDDVTLQGGSPVEGYYCVNSTSGELELVGATGTIGSPPNRPGDFTCEDSGSASSPGDYVQVTASYTYTPLFGNLTVAQLLPSPVTRTAWYRAR